MNDTQRRELYEHLGCSTVNAVTGFPGKRYEQVFGLQAKADKIVAYYEKHRVFCSTQKQLIARIKNEWTAGLGPVASWLMWMAIKTLVTQVVRWLWSRYTP
jgi:hypothetical protein